MRPPLDQQPVIPTQEATLSPPTEHPRRGWREPVEEGIWRMHSTGCPSTKDRKPRRRCDCPYQFKAPGSRPGTTKTVTSYASLMEVRRERAALRAAGRPDPVPATETFTLRQFAHYYLNDREHELARHTIETTSRDYRKWVDPALGHLPLDAITRPVVKSWLSDTIRKAPSRRAWTGGLAALRVILSYAVQEDHLTVNPALRLRLPKRDPRTPRRVERVLTPDQFEHLCKVGATTIDHQTMFRAAGEAGLRRAEAIALTWPNVLFDKRRLRVQASVEQFGRDKRIKTTKSDRERYVGITARFAELLADWYAESVVEGGAPADGFVWPGLNGVEPMSQGTPTQALRRALVRAGLVDAEDEPLVTFHGLRHTAASIMFSRGVPMSTISKQLGHADSKVTAAVYEHLVHDSQLDAAAAAFERPDPDADPDPEPSTTPPTTTGTTVREPVREDAP